MKRFFGKMWGIYRGNFSKNQAVPKKFSQKERLFNTMFWILFIKIDGENPLYFKKNVNNLKWEFSPYYKIIFISNLR